MSCAALNAATDESKDRVGIIADAKPGCGCEAESFSEHSPGLVEEAETIFRMVCVPQHVHPKRPELMSSFFSHAFSSGVSVQRLEQSKPLENIECVEALVGSKDDRAWLGYVQAPASAIREISLGDDGQSYCVADAALPHNRSHAEIHSARRIPEAERIEYRRELMRVFNAKQVLNRRALQDGAVWGGLREDLKARPLPAQWEALN